MTRLMAFSSVVNSVRWKIYDSTLDWILFCKKYQICLVVSSCNITHVNIEASSRLGPKVRSSNRTKSLPKKEAKTRRLIRDRIAQIALFRHFWFINNRIIRSGPFQLTSSIYRPLRLFPPLAILRHSNIGYSRGNKYQNRSNENIPSKLSRAEQK